MAVELGAAYISILPETSKLAPAITKELGKAGSTAARQTGGGLSSALAKWGKRGAIAAGGAIVAGLGTALFKGFGRLTAIENAEAKLRGLGHTTKGVEAIMTNALAAVKGTAFGLDEAASVAASAVAAGVKPGKDLERTLSLVADAATIGGTSMGEMGQIFNKVASTGKIQGEVIQQLGERGIPILQLLGKAIGKTPAEVSKLAAQGKIDFATFQKAMEEGMGGAALKSGETTQGAFKNMMAALSRFGASLLKGVFPIAKQVFGGITTLLDGMGEKIGPVVDRVSGGLQGLFDLFVKGDFTGAFRRAFGVEEDSRLVDFLFDVREGIKGTFDLLVKGDFTSNFARAFNVDEDSKLVDFLLDARDAVTNLGDTFRRLASDRVAASSLATIGGIFTRLWEAVVKLAPSVLDVGVSLAKATTQVGISTWQLLLATVDALSQVAVTVLVPAMQKLARFMRDNQRVVTLAVGAFTAYKVAMIGVRTVTAVTTAITGAYRAVTMGITAASYGAAGATYAQGAALKVYQVITKTTTVATKVWAAAQWLLNAAMRANPIGLVITALTALGAGLVLAYKKSETFRNIVNGAWASIRSAVSTAWNGYIKPALTAFTGFITGTVVPVIQFLWSKIVRPIFGYIGRSMSEWWTQVARPAFQGFKSFLNSVVIPAVRYLWSGVVKPVFSAIGTAISAWWNYYAKPVLSAFRSFLTGVIFPVIRFLWSNVVRPIFDAVGDKIRDVWRNVIKPAFDAMTSAVGKIPSAFSKARDGIGRAWDGLKAKAKAPIRFVVETVINNGLIRAFNFVAKALPGVAEIGKIPLGALGGAGGHGGGRFSRPAGGHAVGGFGGPLDWLKGAAGKVKDFFVGNLRKAAGAVLGPVFDGMRSRIGGNFIGDAAIGLMGKLKDSLLGYAGDKDKANSGLTGRAGKILPAGSYRIGMPYLGYPGHYGSDYPAPVGTPVFAAAAGVVGRARSLTTSYGRHVFLEHPGGVETRYAHLSRYVVAPGQPVGAGQLVGYVGSTGNSTGPHLHFEYRKGGKAINPATLGIFDSGGWLMPGHAAINMSAKREPMAVFNDKQWETLRSLADGKASGPLVQIGQMNTTDPKAAILEMERRQSDAVALANLRGIK